MTRTFDNGLKAQAAAISANRVFHAAQGVPADWDELSDRAQNAWLTVCEEADRLILNNDSIAADEFGKLLYSAFSRYLTRSLDYTPFGQLARPGKFAWEAVGRHLATLLEADDVPDLPTVEDKWHGWANDKAGITGATR